jgi:hypothetical protein
MPSTVIKIVCIPADKSERGALQQEYTVRRKQAYEKAVTFLRANPNQPVPQDSNSIGMSYVIGILDILYQYDSRNDAVTTPVDHKPVPNTFVQVSAEYILQQLIALLPGEGSEPATINASYFQQALEFVANRYQFQVI